MKRVALYVRVSTQEQKNHGISVDNQIDALLEYAKKEGYHVVDIYNDAGISARKSYKHRPDLLRLMQDCKDKKIDLILFTKIDRWFRSVADYYEVQKILDDTKVPWRAIWEDYETETSAGVFKVNIMLSVAQSESDRTSERIKAALEYKKKLGDYVGRVPIGYIRENKRLIIDKDKQEGLSAFFRCYIDGKSVDEAIKAAKQKGVHLKRSASYVILKNEIYTGTVPGKECEPYITEEEYAKINNRFFTRSKRSTPSHRYLFHGLVQCGYCGKMMTVGYNMPKSKNGETRKRYRYLCYSGTFDHICTGRTINENKLEKLMIESLERAVYEYNAKIDYETISKEKNDSEKKIKSLKEKIKRIKDLYEEGDIEKQEYIRKRDEIKSQIYSLSFSLQKEKIELPEDWMTVYHNLSDEGKQTFWSRTIKKIVVFKNNEFSIEFK